MPMKGICMYFIWYRKYQLYLETIWTRIRDDQIISLIHIHLSLAYH